MKKILILLLISSSVLAQDNIDIDFIIGGGRLLGARTVDNQRIIGVLGVDSSGNTVIRADSGKVVELPDFNATGGDIIATADLSIRTNTSSGSDDKLINIIAADTLSNGRAAYLQLKGENYATSPGNAILNAPGNIAIQGVNSDSQVTIAVNGATNVTYTNSQTTTFGGTVTSSRTSDLGWAVVDGADNTACTSQCTSAAVFGFDLSGGATAPVIKGPSDATADICLCAGSS